LLNISFYRRGATPLQYASEFQHHEIYTLLSNLYSTIQLPCHILELPTEILLTIFLYLKRDAATLVNLSQTCSRFHEIAKKDVLWKELCQSFDKKKFSQFIDDLKLSYANNNVQGKEEKEELEISLKEACLKYYKQSYWVPNDWKSWPSVIPADANHDYFFKVSLVGNDGIGKTTFLNRFAVSVHIQQLGYRQLKPLLSFKVNFPTKSR
jgi:hypothetical protein